MFKNIPKIISLIHKQEIESICQILPTFENIKYFVFYAIFNNGQVFVLSNTFNMHIPYYMEELYKHDFSFRKEITANVNYYLCDRTNSVSDEFSSILESRFNIFRAYYLVRNSPECQFVFGCIPEKKVDDFQSYYDSTLEKFEDFCVDFVDKTINIVKMYNPTYTNSIILNDKIYRKSVIKTKNTNRIQLTKNEMDVLNWIAYGKSTEETAIILNQKTANINFFRNQLKKKLNTSNMAHTVFEGIRQGYIGAFNASWRHIDYFANKLPICDQGGNSPNKNKISSLLLLNNNIL